MPSLQGESDDCLARLAKKDGILPKYVPDFISEGGELFKIVMCKMQTLITRLVS